MCYKTIYLDQGRDVFPAKWLQLQLPFFYDTLEAQPMEIELFAVETNAKQSNKDQ